MRILVVPVRGRACRAGRAPRVSSSAPRARAAAGSRAPSAGRRRRPSRRHVARRDLEVVRLGAGRRQVRDRDVRHRRSARLRTRAGRRRRRPCAVLRRPSSRCRRGRPVSDRGDDDRRDEMRMILIRMQRYATEHGHGGASPVPEEESGPRDSGSVVFEELASEPNDATAIQLYDRLRRRGDERRPRDRVPDARAPQRAGRGRHAHSPRRRALLPALRRRAPSSPRLHELPPGRRAGRTATSSRGSKRSAASTASAPPSHQVEIAGVCADCR